MYDLKEYEKKFISNLYEKHKDEYKLIDNYKGIHKESLFIHSECGTKFYAKPENVLKSVRCCCPNCKNKKRTKTNEWFVNEFYKYNDINEYELLSEYISSDSKIKIKHLICGNEFEVWAKYAKSGKLNCKYCYGSILWTHDMFLQKIFELFGNKYTVLSQYHNSQTKIKIRHEKCGNEYWIKPNSLINGNKCRFCRYDHIRKSKEQFFNDFNLREDANNFEFLSDYIDYKSKILLKSKNCGHIFYSTPNRLLSKKSTCPICYKSKGEDRIINFLENNDIKYQKEKTYQDLKGRLGGALRYDFFIFYNDKSFICEYNGEQHLRFVKGFHRTQERFERLQENDKIKREYAKNNNIDLLDIWYWDFENIESILKEKLKL